MHLTLASARDRFTVVGITLVVFSILAGSVYLITPRSAVAYQTGAEKDPFVRFTMEAFDQINKNYWIKPGTFGQFNSPELPQIFQLALAKEGIAVSLATSTRSGVATLLADAFKTATSSAAKKQIAVQTLQLVLYNLPPLGRDSILSQSQVTALRQEVANVNPSNDLYQNLGVEKGASVGAVDAAYAAKQAELAKATTTAAKAELAQVTYAHKVLTNASQKQRYDTAQVEPSVFAHTLGKTLYLSFNKIAPTSLQEFALAVDTASTTPGLDSMILDMRGNIGGALDFTQAFVGLFVGNNQYAYDLYHQGDTNPQRTTLGQFPELARYTDIAVLTDNQTQSTAELTTAAMKRLRLAHVVGIRTRGWGSVENTYPLTTSIDPSTTYALLLVNSLTLRDDQQPIEQNGVTPNIDTSAAGWENKLAGTFSSPSVIAALRQEATAPPLR